MSPDDVSTDGRRNGNLGYWCYDACRRYPDKTALIDLSASTPRKVAYCELDDRMNRFARLVSDAGIGRGERVALGLGNRFEFVEIMFGVMRAGAVPVPLNFKLGVDALGHVVSDSGCRAAFVDPVAAERAADVVEQAGIEVRWVLGGPDRPGWCDYETALADASPTFEPPRVDPDDMAFLPYTSGSTGKPKGVVLPHAGQLWWLQCAQRYWPMEAQERALVAVPLYHKNAMLGAVKPLLQVGGSVVILPEFEPESFLRALGDHGCTRVSGVPALFAIALNHRDLIRELDFSTLRTITVGSAPVPPELLDALERTFDAAVGESYGLTEGGPVMLGPPVDGRPVPRGSCGAAWPEGEVKLVRDGVEHASDGELWVRNPGVTPGYHNLPDVTAERITDGWLATGDLFHRDADGFFYFRGRTDDMFNSGGENIYPKEVEDLLVTHPDVLAAVVQPLPHIVKGQVPAAMVVTVAGSTVSPDELKAYTLEHGPAYAHPRRILIADELPLTGPGKPDRQAIAEVLRAGGDQGHRFKRG